MTPNKKCKNNFLAHNIFNFENGYKYVEIDECHTEGIFSMSWTIDIVLKELIILELFSNLKILLT